MGGFKTPPNLPNPHPPCQGEKQGGGVLAPARCGVLPPLTRGGWEGFAHRTDAK